MGAMRDFVNAVQDAVRLFFATKRANSIWDRALAAAHVSAERAVAALPGDAVVDDHLRDMFRGDHVRHALAEELRRVSHGDTLVGGILRGRIKARLAGESEEGATSSQITPQLAGKLESHAWCLAHVQRFLPRRENILLVRLGVQGDPGARRLLGASGAHQYYWIHTPSIRFPSLGHAFAHVSGLHEKHARTVKAGFDASEERSVVIFHHHRPVPSPGFVQTYHAGHLRLCDADLREYQSMLHRGSDASLNFGGVKAKTDDC
jgi:hypothetical protein